ncbi:flavin reductase (DIM6/NTAB) family NADH-FMN oxidoreductase RutF [Albidovulum inexpectatum]|uniref:Flavin reductase (DIM6/NTAB) family NADH-FMN oxidoreductase RutF n=1 Tax=Albidovulum inexpectatum TaxID=196587 RepID=A0A2S5JHV4_9RHOB|nr:flavin reductase family protein [Albidovulum inexpectatum]PPB81097.1 flavin reductase (DIM6/NTAB) family NADH-FMN oxidoreductase RutF [Albidovulum inexpectatum]
MFYRPQDGHGLPHNPFNAIVAPRPIGWIATRGRLGDNLAPYSFFNAVAYTPPQVMFASTARKDSLRNIEETGVFSVNIVASEMAERMNLTSATLPAGTDEFIHASVPKAECETIDCPRVADSPAVLECTARQILRLEGPDNHMVIAEVTGIHMRDDCLRDGRFDLTLVRPLARCGYRDYARIDSVFEMPRPDEA